MNDDSHDAMYQKLSFRNARRYEPTVERVLKECERDHQRTKERHSKGQKREK